MKTAFLTRSRFGYTCLVIFLTIALANAQSMPFESPKAKTSLTLGLTEITIDYSRPGVKGRAIFGELVPYGKVWRTGANYPTLIELTDTTFFGEEKAVLLPGKYALYTIPGKKNWTVIFSNKTSLWGAYGYNANDDALRFEVTPYKSKTFYESFSIAFENISGSTCDLSLCWENIRVSFPISVDIVGEVLYGMQVEHSPEYKKKHNLYGEGARFLLNHKQHPQLAIQWADSAMKDGVYWGDMWTKACIMAWQGNYEEAVALGEKALAIGTSEKLKPYFPYEESYSKQIGRWKKRKD